MPSATRRPVRFALPDLRALRRSTRRWLRARMASTLLGTRPRAPTAQRDTSALLPRSPLASAPWASILSKGTATATSAQLDTNVLCRVFHLYNAPRATTPRATALTARSVHLATSAPRVRSKRLLQMESVPKVTTAPTREPCTSARPVRTLISPEARPTPCVRTAPRVPTVRTRAPKTWKPPLCVVRGTTVRRGPWITSTPPAPQGRTAPRLG
mmetsp:Transcript_7498/g.14603  ORF Transcript_7498/g.14603 Transcript_7498/m.14603 type:complete len:213 (+) Transcript_7498:320-958(+)